MSRIGALTGALVEEVWRVFEDGGGIGGVNDDLGSTAVAYLRMSRDSGR